MDIHYIPYASHKWMYKSWYSNINLDCFISYWWQRPTFNYCITKLVRWKVSWKSISKMYLHFVKTVSKSILKTKDNAMFKKDLKIQGKILSWMLEIKIMSSSFLHITGSAQVWKPLLVLTTWAGKSPAGPCGTYGVICWVLCAHSRDRQAQTHTVLYYIIW